MNFQRGVYKNIDIIIDISHRQSHFNLLEDPVAKQFAVGSNEPHSLTHVPPAAFAQKPNRGHMLEQNCVRGLQSWFNLLKHKLAFKHALNITWTY